jgi:hypothetical protein
MTLLFHAKLNIAAEQGHGELCYRSQNRVSYSALGASLDRIAQLGGYGSMVVPQQYRRRCAEVEHVEQNCCYLVIA